MSEKFKIETQSIKGTKFSIEFQIEENGSWRLSNLPPLPKKNYWNWNTSYYYKTYPVLKEILFVVNFLKENQIKLNRLSARDLSEIICMLLELKIVLKQNTVGSVMIKRYPNKALVLTHAIKDLETGFKLI